MYPARVFRTLQNQGTPKYQQHVMPVPIKIMHSTHGPAAVMIEPSPTIFSQTYSSMTRLGFGFGFGFLGLWRASKRWFLVLLPHQHFPFLVSLFCLILPCWFWSWTQALLVLPSVDFWALMRDWRGRLSSETAWLLAPCSPLLTPRYLFTPSQHWGSAINTAAY